MPLTLAESLVHTLNPFAIQFTETFGIRWYGLSYMSGFVVAWLLVRWLAGSKRIPLPAALVGDYITACVLGVIIGGRLGHAVLYDRALFWTFHDSFPWWGLLEIHKGGMASHGGITGVFLANVFFAYRHALPVLCLADTAAFIAPPGLMFGRLANWVNGELPGKLLPDAMQADPPAWSVKYPEELLQRAQTPEAYANAKHLVTMAYAHDPDAIARVAAMVPARYPNNFIQALTDGPMLMTILVLVWLKPRHGGTLFGAFLVGYGILRNVSEQFRVPDEDVFAIGHVTLPMMLSAGMVLAGITIIAWARRSRQPLAGGLLSA